MALEHSSPVPICGLLKPRKVRSELNVGGLECEAIGGRGRKVSIGVRVGVGMSVRVVEASVKSNKNGKKRAFTLPKKPFISGLSSSFVGKAGKALPVFFG